MSSKPAPSTEILQSHEAAFIEHYSWLIRWALQLTKNDRARAEDLVQEVFAQLAFRHTNLSSVNNIPAYLYSTLRNIHASEMRLAGRSHIQSLSIVEYNLAATALSACNPHDLYQTQDQLRRICYYSCVRKESSRAGSVMILRFFLGYHLSEVALVLGGTCQAVRQCLRFARNEARAFVDDPNALAFINGAKTLKRIFPNTVHGAEELLADLRLAIFRSNQGECLNADLLKAFYQKGLVLTASNSTLAHVVSCRRCLDTANRVLNLPLLAERHPADALGPDSSSRRGPGAPGGSGARRGGNFGNEDCKAEITSSFLLRCRRRARELFEHYPRELCVSVNGHLLGSQSVNSETSRLRLDITIPEPLSFVEVLSEENARLMVMPIDEPPSAEPMQMRHVGLSEGRYIEVTLHHGHPWPMLEVVYHDPNFTSELFIPESNAYETWGVSGAQNLSAVPRGVESGACPDELQASQNEPNDKISRLNITLRRFLTLLASPASAARNIWSHPSLITAIVSIFMIATILYVRSGFAPAVSAAGLIERATVAEQALNGTKDRAVHRVINLEERTGAGGDLIARSRIEIWRESGANRSVRRVYDEKGRLIAGEWESNHSKPNETASRTLYRRGEVARTEPLVRNPQIAALELWQLEPSAETYLEIIGRADAAHVTEDSSAYVISYAADRQPLMGGALLRATLTLRKADLHPVEQTLILQRGQETREYRLVEASFEQRPVGAVAPAVFEVDPELISGAGNGEGVKVKAASNSLESSAKNHNVAVVATPELEIEVTYLLDQFRSILGDQVNLTRTAEGLLRVDGVVDTDQRKQEILHALSPVMNNPAVKVEIYTATEALARQQGRSPNRVITREFSGSDNAIPAYEELYRYFSRNVGHASAEDDRIQQEVRSLAARVVGRSRRVLSHAIELKQLEERFSDAQLKVLTPNAQLKFFGMLRAHAELLRREASLLSEDLAPVFPTNTQDVEIGDVEISTTSDLAIVIERLYKLAVANDERIRSAFSASSEASSTTALVDGAHFRASLAAAEKFAIKIREAATSLESHHDDK